MIKLLMPIFLGMIALAGGATAYGAPTAPFVHDHFYRGNLHSHTNRTDGDVSPERLIEAYRAEGYHFLALTDHNLTTPPGAFASLHTPGFITMSGNEVSDGVPSARPVELYDRPLISVHANALCLSAPLAGARHENMTAAVPAVAQRVRAAGAGVLQINHPNYESAFSWEEMLPVEGPYLLEVANMHPHVQGEGEAWYQSPDEIRMPVERMWDELLTRGRRVYGTATDDVHDLERDPGFRRRLPFQGWVQVAAAELTEESLCRALSEGRFYSSSGVELQGLSFDGARLSLSIREQADHVPVTIFISDRGVIRQATAGSYVSYRLRGDESYVRAVVFGAGGKKAWIQPVFPR